MEYLVILIIIVVACNAGSKKETYSPCKALFCNKMKNDKYDYCHKHK